MDRIHWAGTLPAGLALALAALIAPPASAQQQPVTIAALAPTPASTPQSISASNTNAALGPTYAAAQSGFHQDAIAPTQLNHDAFKTSRREGRALAIVGAAAVITGILIGGDGGTIIAVGGAGLGLYGLYIWQR